MSTSDHFLLALQAYQEIRQELQQQEEPVLKTIQDPMEDKSTGRRLAIDWPG